MPRGKPTPTTFHRGDLAGPAPAGAAVAVELFLTREELAARIGVHPNHLTAMTQRGQVECIRLGARTLYPWGIWVLRSVGLDDPSRLGTFVKASGISSLEELLRFICGDGGAP